MIGIADDHPSIRNVTPQEINDDLLFADQFRQHADLVDDCLQSLAVKQQLEAPILLTFCNDVFRIREWIRFNNSIQGFDDFWGFLTGTADTIIAA